MPVCRENGLYFLLQLCQAASEWSFVVVQVLIPLHNIKDCSSHGDIFEVEEDGREC